jgi:hypothetical protein
LLNTFSGNLVFLPGLVRCTYKNWQPWLWLLCFFKITTAGPARVRSLDPFAATT